MKQLENLVRKFLAEEDFSLRNTLAYAGLGLSKTTGQASEIINGVGFAEQPYTRERQLKMAELLGEMLFYWNVLATTIDGIDIEEIVAEYVSSYEAIKNIAQDQRITIQDMMEMRKHVKPGALRDLERAKDAEEKQRIRETMFN